MMGDTQRQSSYRFERYLVQRTSGSGLDRPLSDWEAAEFVGIIWKAYFPDDAPPRVRFPPHGRIAWARGYVVISLPPWSRQPWTIYHEVAHSIIAKSGHRHEIESHGPEWVRLYFNILRDFGGIPEEELVAALRGWNRAFRRKGTAILRIAKASNGRVPVWAEKPEPVLVAASESHDVAPAGWWFRQIKAPGVGVLETQGLLFGGASPAEKTSRSSPELG